MQRYREGVDQEREGTPEWQGPVRPEEAVVIAGNSIRGVFVRRVSREQEGLKESIVASLTSL